MTMHGTVSFWRTLQWDRARKAAADTPRKGRAPGFRHFIGSPRKYQRFRLDGVPFDPSDDAMWKRAEALMGKLATAMWDARPPKGEEHGLQKEFNRNLPSGYTYFLQIMAHDLVHSSIAVSRNSGQLAGLANARRLPLRLDTIYGGSSMVCPHAYTKDKHSGFRNHLRLGRIRKDGTGYQNNKGPELDIARARATDVLCDAKYPEVLIADPRNDSHAIISQMVMVGHHLHNYILDTLIRSGGEPTGSKFTHAQRAFLAAQSTAILLYREFIQKCVLPKILHPDIEKAYRLNHVPLLDDTRDLTRYRWRAPLEFTFGFFRFGHSMIRDNYQLSSKFEADIGPILSRTSDAWPEAMPFEQKWTIDWRYFFSHKLFTDDPSKKNNFSVRIGPWGKQSPGDDVSEGGDGDKLIFRDLVSSITARPWSIAALIDRMWATHGGLLAKSELFRKCDPQSDERPWAKCIGDWLKERNAARPGLLSPEDIKTLSEDPPIPFFVRFEAAHEAEGKHLGILGSIVVADVLHGILRHDAILGVESVGNLKKQLCSLGTFLFNDSNMLLPFSEPEALAPALAPLGIMFSIESETA